MLANIYNLLAFSKKESDTVLISLSNNTSSPYLLKIQVVNGEIYSVVYRNKKGKDVLREIDLKDFNNIVGIEHKHFYTVRDILPIPEEIILGIFKESGKDEVLVLNTPHTDQG